MNFKPYLLIPVLTLFFQQVSAQEVTFKTEYLGQSGYYYLPPGEQPREKIGDGKGSAMVYQAGVNIPLSLKLNENKRPTAWGVGISGSYVSLKNQNFSETMVSEIMNAQIGVYHLRPLNDRWSLRASVGMGIFAPTTDFSKLSFKNVLASGSAVFIRHLKPNLSIGGGLAINSSLGYPMIFPAVYVNWQSEGKFDVNVELVDGLEASIGYDVSEKFKLSYALEMNGQVALLKKDDRDVIFSHQYIITGFKPQMQINEKLTITGMAGLNIYRPASYSNRTLKGVFAGDNDYFFSASPYVSLGLNMKF
ncbi:MAG: DUF6268 family outer membrane beta-barrel protein [Sphingobacterium sp.]